MVIKLKRIFSIIFLISLILSITISSIPAPTIYKVDHIEIYDKDNNLITSEIENKPGEYVYLTELNEHTINAFIAFEDKNFFNHKGFDFFRIIKSFFHNIFTLSFSQGASTITQQYARSVFLNNKKSLIRKAKEAYYTIKLETNYTKNQILEGYLNTIYLGHGCYGIDAASRYYFNKSSKDLSLVEAATLASLPSSPTSSSPYLNYQKSKERRNKVLESMKDENYINKKEYEEAINQDITLSNSYTQTNINYYLDQAKQILKKENLSLNKGIKIYTNLDMHLYNNISSLVEKYNTYNNQMSLLVLENNSNKILFNIGGYDYSLSNYNRSLYSKRQVGSTIKTFLYALALENEFTLDTSLKSEKTTFNIKNYGIYSPSNSNKIYANKVITMKEAYAVSDNIYAIKTLLLLGSDNFIKYLNKFNLKIDESVPSIALGSCELTLLELLKAYSVFANNGYYYNYSFVNKITDSYDNTLYETPLTKTLTIKKDIVDNIKELMSLPFYNNNYYTKATLENYNIKGYYGKSGSTSTDSYLILFNEKYTIGIWLGNDENNEIYDYTTTKYLLKDITEIL